MLDSLWNDRQCRMLICYPQYVCGVQFEFPRFGMVEGEITDIYR